MNHKCTVWKEPEYGNWYYRCLFCSYHNIEPTWIDAMFWAIAHRNLNS